MWEKNWKENANKIIFLCLIFLFIILALWRADIQTLFIWDHDTDTLGQDEILIDEKWQDQRLKCRGNTLSIINVCFGHVDTDGNGSAYLKLMDGGEEVCSWEREISGIIEGDYTQFELPGQMSGVLGKELALSIKCDPGIEGLSVTDICYVYGSVNRKIIYSILFLMIALIMAAAIWAGKSKKLKLEQKFLVFAFVTGFCYMVSIPLSQSPDDLFHFERIWDVLEGNIISHLEGTQAGGMLPGNLFGELEFGAEYADIFINSHQNINLGEKQWYIFPNTALYSPIAYLPEAIGVWVGKSLSPNVLWVSWMGRLAGLLFSLAVLYQAIRIIPCKKYSILLIALLPIFLQEEVALGTDYFVNSVLIFFVSYVLAVSLEDGKTMDRKRMLLLSVMSFCAAMCKVVYLPFCLLLFLVPNKRFANRKHAFFFKIGNMVTAVFFNLLWLAGTSGFIDGFSGRSNSKEQVLYIISHPIAYLRVMYNTVAVYGANMALGVLGSGLGWISNIDVNRLIIFILLVLFVLLGLCDAVDSVSIGKRNKMVLGLISVSVAVLTFTSLYVQFTSVGHPMIEGIQGRYFIPLMLPFSLIIGGKVYWKEKKNYDMYLFPFLGYVHAIVIITIVKNMAV